MLDMDQKDAKRKYRMVVIGSTGGDVRLGLPAKAVQMRPEETEN